MALTKVDKSVSSTPSIVDNGDATAITITSDENVGIGTTTINTGTLGTSNTFLEVAAGTNSGSGTIILSRTTSGNDNEVGGLRFVNSDNADDDGLDSDGKLVAAISARSVTSDSNAGDDSGANLILYTKPEAGNYAERMRISSNGNVGIGNSGPHQKLMVTGPIVLTGALSGLGAAGNYTHGALNGTALDYYGDNARSWSWGNATTRGKFTWYQLENDGQNQITSMTLDTSGNLLLGTTSTYNGGHTVYKAATVPLSVSRGDGAAGNSLILGYGSGTTLRISIRGDGDIENSNNSYGPLASDERLKENIVDVSSQWEDVKNIKLKNFTYKNDSSGLVQMGPIAQELEKVSPNLIKRKEASLEDIENSGGLIKEGDEVLTYKASIMQLKGFVALQEAMIKIEKLQEQIEALQAEINTLKGE